MALLSKRVTYELTNADATVTGLGASATVTRWIRSVHVSCYGTSTYSLGVGATFANATSLIAAKVMTAANTYDHYYGGKGIRVDNANIRALAGANTSGAMTIVYDELDLT
jgi:hypothetical protein